jgi:acyl-coenzyme A thioesterase PaaI-like protein
LTSEPDVVNPESRAGQTITFGTTRFEFEPHNCFACGTLNTNGLQLRLHMEPGRSWTELRLDRRFEGWDGIAHGGIVCTILDEVMAWALVAQDNWGVTARLNVAFRRPVLVGHPIRADGWVTRARGR